MCSATFAAISRNQKIDMQDGKNYAHNMCKLHGAYTKMQAQHQIRQLSRQCAPIPEGKIARIEEAVIRDTAVLHQALLNKEELPKLHIEQIERTVKEEVASLKRFTVVDVEGAANSIFKETTSEKWVDALDYKSQDQCRYLKLKATATSIDEFFQGSNGIDINIKERLTRDSTFLLQRHCSEKMLLTELKSSVDLLAVANSWRNRCAESAELTVKADISKIERLGYDDTTKFLQTNKAKYQEFSIYLDNSIVTPNLKHFSERLEIHDISEQHKSQTPELVKEFRNELAVSYNLRPSRSKDILQQYKEKGIEQAVKYTKDTNLRDVLNRLEKQIDILGIGENQKGDDYTKLIAKDSRIMQYVDMAMKDKNACQHREPLLPFMNQREIDNITSTLQSEPAQLKQFNEQINDLKRFGNNGQLQEALELYKDKNIHVMERYTNGVCKDAVAVEISSKLRQIERGEVVELENGSKCSTKSSYLTALNSDTQVMKHIPEHSSIARDIQKACHENTQKQELEALNQTKQPSYDFER